MLNPVNWFRLLTAGFDRTELAIDYSIGISSAAAPSVTCWPRMAPGSTSQRYDLESLTLMRRSLTEWAQVLSTRTRVVTPYFITLDFQSIADAKERSVFNTMATSFSLPAEEVDALKEAGHRMLRESDDFQRLIKQLNTCD
jgi:NTE family protein